MQSLGRAERERAVPVHGLETRGRTTKTMGSKATGLHKQRRLRLREKGQATVRVRSDQSIHLETNNKQTVE